jgi:hypothetical protein
VLSSANDTVKGIVFYFALLIPFAFFAEALLFGFADIRKRIAGFAFCFLAVFFMLRAVHPAFSLAMSPYVILLAFVIMALSGVTIIIVVSKFKQEIAKMRAEAHGLHESDVGRLSAAGAAVLLGIANLRRRPLRTGLTAITIILLTFTVLSFTSVKTTISFFRLPLGKVALYRGALARNRDLSLLGDFYLPSLQDSFQEVAELIPRRWNAQENPSIGKYSLEVASSDWKRMGLINAICAYEARELDLLPAIQRAIVPGGRWFHEGERNVCMISEVLAGVLGIRPQDFADEKQEHRPTIVFQGRPLTVIGLFNNELMNRVTDLDGEGILPPEPGAANTAFLTGTTVTQAVGSEIQATSDIVQIPRMDGAGLLFVSAADAQEFGCAIHSIAVRNRTDDDRFAAALKGFLARTGTMVFASERDQKSSDYRVVAFSSFGTTNLRGIGNLAIPILIAALIVLNTMMGAVHERTREIGIYCSVGLAPNHIGALFLAESCVFATIGAVLGYLIGQIVARTLVSTGWIEGLNLNYSSFSAVICTMIVMATVFLSTVYPAKKAADLSVPDVSRRWIIPEPKGDTWTFDFPFTVGGSDVIGLYTFLMHYFESYGESSIGEFYAEKVCLEPLDGSAGRKFRVSLTAWLAPFDLGISQAVSLDAIETGNHNIYKVEVQIERLSGDRESWRRMNRGFLNLLRKRFLVWRTAPDGLRVKLTEEGQRILLGGSGARA